MKFLFLLMLLSFTAQASRETGNGGDGYRINGKLYLLDFVESGRELNPYLSATVVLHPGWTQRIARVLSGIPDAPVMEVATKVSEIYALDRVAAVAIVKAMEFYSWRMVRYELPNVEDEHSVVPPPYLQLAIRRGASIYLQEMFWRELDQANKAGLIFHEAIYALVKPVAVDGKLFQFSYQAREYVSYLFSPEFSREDIWRFSNRAENILPHSYYHNTQQMEDPREYIYQLGSHSELIGKYEKKYGNGISSRDFGLMEPGMIDNSLDPSPLADYIALECSLNREEQGCDIKITVFRRDWLFDFALASLSDADSAKYVQWNFGKYADRQQSEFSGLKSKMGVWKTAKGASLIYDAECARVVDDAYRKMFRWAKD